MSSNDYQPVVCNRCCTAAYNADTCPDKRDLSWQEDFCFWHGDILAEHSCEGECDCACDAAETDWVVKGQHGKAE